MKERKSVRTMMMVAVLGLAAASCTTRGEAEGRTNAERVERGKYLVTIGGCNDCHTPLPMPEVKVPGPWGWAGAVTNTAFSGPWGVSYAFNLTPDEHTGIGIWTEDIFMKTIRTGRHWGVARPILPPMPWFNYRQMSDEDLRSVYAYLRTIPAVSNKVPDAFIAEPPAITTD
jgi:mono/diheme cytochrome c family protein